MDGRVSHYSWIGLLNFFVEAAQRRLGRSLSVAFTAGDFLCEFALCGVVCAFYQAGLKSTTTTAAAAFELDELPTIERLTAHVAAGDYKLVVDSMVDFRFEFINKSQSEDVRRFRAALEKNPPILVKNTADVCDYIIDGRQKDAVVSTSQWPIQETYL